MSPRRTLSRRVNKHVKSMHCECGQSYVRADYYIRHKQTHGHNSEFLAASAPLPDPESDPRPFYCACGAGFTAHFAFERHRRNTKHEGDWLRSKFQPRGHQEGLLAAASDAQDDLGSPDSVEASQQDFQVFTAHEDARRPIRDTTPDRPAPTVPFGSDDSGLGSSIAELTPLRNQTDSSPSSDSTRNIAGPSRFAPRTCPAVDPSEDDETANDQLLGEQQMGIQQRPNLQTVEIPEVQPPRAYGRSRFLGVDSDFDETIERPNFDIDVEEEMEEEMALTEAPSITDQQGPLPPSRRSVDAEHNCGIDDSHENVAPQYDHHVDGDRIKDFINAEQRHNKAVRAQGERREEDFATIVDIAARTRSSRDHVRRGLQDAHSPRRRNSQRRDHIRTTKTGVKKKRGLGKRIYSFLYDHKNHLIPIAALVGMVGIYLKMRSPSLATTLGNNDWVLDSTAPLHIAKYSSIFSNVDFIHKVCPYPRARHCNWTGTVPLEFKSGKILLLKDVLYRPRASSNTVSLGKLGEAGLGGMWTGKDITITNLTDNDGIGRAGKYGNLYLLDDLAPPKPATEWPSHRESGKRSLGSAESKTELSKFTTTYLPYIPGMEYSASTSTESFKTASSADRDITSAVTAPQLAPSSYESTTSSTVYQSSTPYDWLKSPPVGLNDTVLPTATSTRSKAPSTIDNAIHPTTDADGAIPFIQTSTPPHSNLTSTPADNLIDSGSLPRPSERPRSAPAKRPRPDDGEISNEPPRKKIGVEEEIEKFRRKLEDCKRRLLKDQYDRPSQFPGWLRLRNWLRASPTSEIKVLPPTRSSTSTPWASWTSPALPPLPWFNHMDTRAHVLDKLTQRRQTVRHARERLGQERREIGEAAYAGYPPCPPCPPCGDEE